MYGGPGSEGGGRVGYMFGGFGNDVMKGGKAPDAIYGEEGYDKLYGGSGHDTVDGSNGRDRLFGNGGNDTIDTGFRDRAKDYVDCGPGNDYVFADRNDTVVNCESKQ